jgi:hypothetical protein
MEDVLDLKREKPDVRTKSYGGQNWGLMHF